jgi:hypothetical protein
MLTGLDWARPFINEFGDELGLSTSSTYSGDYVDATYACDVSGVRQRWVVAKHPQGKNENRLVAEVMQALRG